MENASRMQAEALKPQGSAFRQMFRSQWGTPQGREHVQMSTGADATAAAPRFSNRGSRFFRSLDFSFVKTGFGAMQAGKARRSNMLMFLIPLTFGVGIGAMHFVSQSFMVYLKY